MFFDTPVYFVFLALVVITYWRLGRAKQNVFLLAASYFFYGWWDWRFLVLILVSSVFDYFAALYITQSANAARRRTLLAASLLLNFGFLGVFKYFNFFADSLYASLSALGYHDLNHSILRILLPPGISFYTFQAVAYMVDVYRGELKPARSFIDYALFISFFPHLVAGPIQRPSHLLPQVQEERRRNHESFFDGLMLILSGLFQKCVIADNCALIANAAFSGRFGTPHIGSVMLGSWAFAWQIYADFSGYTDIARGSAQLMGFHFMVNFRQPYLATSLQDFWRRWHISLSTWLRDYLYIPLGGSRDGETKTYRNLLLTMLLGGLWHGANWTYVIWGALHGTILSLERFLGIGATPKEGFTSTAVIWFRRMLLFQVVCFAWIFFRAQTFADARAFIGGLHVLRLGPEFVPAMIFLAFFTLPLFLIDCINHKRGEEYLMQRASGAWQLGTATMFTLLVLAFAANNSAAFIYFQF